MEGHLLVPTFFYSSTGHARVDTVSLQVALDYRTCADNDIIRDCRSRQQHAVGPDQDIIAYGDVACDFHIGYLLLTLIVVRIGNDLCAGANGNIPAYHHTTNTDVDIAEGPKMRAFPYLQSPAGIQNIATMVKTTVGARSEIPPVHDVNIGVQSALRSVQALPQVHGKGGSVRPYA
jgi:hypothetical protein